MRMEAEGAKTSINWEKKYKELREEYTWLWGQFKRIAKLLEVGNGKRK